MPSTVPKVSLFEDTQIAFSHQSNEELKKSYRLFQSFNNPLLFTIGKAVTSIAFQLKLPIEGILRNNIYDQFLGGENLEDCKAAIQHLANHNISTGLQFSIETKSSEDEFNRTAEQLRNSIYLAEDIPRIKVVCCKLTGIGSLELFEKLHAKASLSEQDKLALEHIRQRMESICSAAEKTGVSVFFDAEESWIQQPMDDLIDEMMLRYNRKKGIIYNTFQLYRTDRLDFLQASFQKAKKNNFILGAKLVRGAYMEKERDWAKSKGYPSPIYPDKVAADKAYNDSMEFCLNNIGGISFCAATHNEQSCSYLAEMIDQRGIRRNHPDIFFSQLYGMGEHLTYNLAKAGFNAIKLIPYGPVLEAIPYLIRRAEENTSMAGQVSREMQMLRKEMVRRRMI